MNCCVIRKIGVLRYKNQVNEIMCIRCYKQNYALKHMNKSDRTYREFARYVPVVVVFFVLFVLLEDILKIVIMQEAFAVLGGMFLVGSFFALFCGLVSICVFDELYLQRKYDCFLEHLK